MPSRTSSSSASAAARRVLAVSHENPDADTLGADLGVVHLVEALGGVADPVCTDPVAAAVRLPDRRRPLPDRPRSRRADYDLLVISDCGSLERVGAVAARHADLFARLPRVVIDHHASNRGRRRRRLDRPERGRDVRDGRRSSRPGSASRSTRRTARWPTALMAGIVMDTATFAHPNATPRTLAVSAALVEAGAPLSDISRRLYRTKPDAQLRLFGRVLDRLESADDGRIVWSSLTDADIAATGAAARRTREGIIDLLVPGRGGRGRDPVQGGRQGDPDQRPDQARRRRRDGPDRRGSVAAGTPARPAPRSRRRSTRRGRAVLAEASRLVAALGSLTRGALVARPRARRHPRRRQAGRPDVARHRRAGPASWPPRSGSVTAARSTRSPRASCRSSWATRRASSSTTWATARRYRATVCFGASSTTDDLEGELTPVRRHRRRRARRSRRRSPGLTGTISQRPPAYSAIKVGGRRAYAHGPRRRDGRARRARGHDPRARPRRRGTAPTRDRPIAIIDVACSAGHLHPRARPRPRREPRERRLPRRADADRVGTVHAG